MEKIDPRDLEWCTLPFNFVAECNAFDRALLSWLRSLSREAKANTQRQSGLGFEFQELA